MEAQPDKKKKKCAYNKQRYQENKEHILQYRRERYKKIHHKTNKISVERGEFVLNFDEFFFFNFIISKICKIIPRVCSRQSCQEFNRNTSRINDAAMRTIYCLLELLRCV